MTPNKEDYLKCIYELSHTYDKINNKLIAEKMAVSAPAVSGMVKKLLDETYIEKHIEYGYRITDKGMKSVSQLIRKHRLIEVFLIKHLGYTIDEVHNEAEVLEHTVSDYFVDSLDKYLDYPTHCPHGGKIPKKDELLVENEIALSRVANGIYRIRRLVDNSQLLLFLKQYHIKVGSLIRLIEHNVFAKLVTIEVDGQTHILSDIICKQIFVEPVS